MIGQRLSRFEITAKLGEGGMGEVYRARDPRLDREVAIKVLPADFVADPERLARFEREAKVLASLNHPNVAAIYEVGESEGVHFLAMELAEGEDLARRLERGPLPVDTAIPVAIQIAEGLEAAHERGIVHRDLKPGNVMLDPRTERVKLLDFGLAKAREGASGSSADLTRSPTLTAQMTQAGVILGTAAYMSPEQARGKAVDKRADIWAFGCILFEMLAGQRPFAGSDVAEILAAVIRAEPEWDRLPASVPERLRRLLGRCLHKDPRHRLRDIGDAWNELREIQDAGAPEAPGAGVSAQPSAPSRLPWLVAGLLAVTSLVLAVVALRSDDEPAAVRRFAIDLPWHSVPNWTDFVAAISPTGDAIAYNGRIGNRVDAWVRPLDNLEGQALAPARETTSLAFSPDGSWLAIQNGSELSKVPVRGGPPVPLAQLVRLRAQGNITASLDPFGLSWGPRDDLLIATLEGLHRVPAGGGEPEQVTRLGEASDADQHDDPHHLPDGKRALLTLNREGSPPRIGVVDLDTGAVTALPVNGAAPSYAGSGHLVFRRGSTAMAVPFDPDSLAVGGEPVAVLEDVRWGPLIADDGTMLYIPERGEAHARPVWTDRNGLAVPVDEEPRDYSHLDLSSDGRTAVLNVGSDAYELDLASGARQLLATRALFPIFTSDDRRVTVYNSPHRILQLAADGSGDPATLVDAQTTVRDAADGRRPIGTLVPTSWNARTGELAFFDDASDIWILDPEGTIRPLLQSPAHERTGRFSPDGRWLAYVSDETDQYEVYVTAYPGPGRKVAVSVDGGLSPIWSPDGDELFFRRGGQLVVANVRYEPELSFGAPTVLFEGPFTLDLMGHQRWDVAPDGERFMMVESSADFRIVIVENWFSELERLAPVR